MSATSGPDIVSDSLVFYYDTGNSRDSYKGEPTTNNVVDQRYSIQPSRGVSDVSASWSESEQAWYVTLPSGSETFYRGIRLITTNNQYRVYEPTGSVVSFSYKVQAISSGLWNFIDLNNGAATGSTSYGNDNRSSSTYTNTTFELIPGVVNQVKVTYTTQANDPLVTGSLYFCYNTMCLAPPNATNTNINNGGAISEAKTVKIWDIQHELKDHVTQFVNGTRSATQGLLDISGQDTSIDISNASFDSNAQMTFDGTDDKLHGIQTVHSYLSSSAIEFIVSPETSNKRMMVGGYRHNGGYSWPTIGSVFIDSDNKFKASVITTTEVYRFVGSSTTINANQTYHVIFNKNTSDGTMELYVNGILESSQTFDASTYAQWASAGNYIGSNNIDLGKSFNTNSGQGWSGDYLEGKIHIFKIHSRILTAAEVKQNYDSIKTRFGLT